MQQDSPKPVQPHLEQGPPSRSVQLSCEVRVLGSPDLAHSALPVMYPQEALVPGLAASLPDSEDARMPE